MTTHSGEFRITVMSRALVVSRSGFYRWLHGGSPGPRSTARAKLDARVKAAFERFKRRYGAPRITRQAIGWAMDETMTAQLVCNALQMVLWRRKMPRGTIMHTDRGSQYCSHAYQRMLRKHGLVCSMSGKGNCYDNALRG